MYHAYVCMHVCMYVHIGTPAALAATVSSVQRELEVY